MTKNNTADTSNTNNQASGKYLLDTSREYSIYVCSNRAIPSVADGLKDSQRKAIWVIRNQAEQIKTISLAGAMINSNIYLHGDSSAADAISQLAAPYCNNVCYLEGIGNFGTKVSPTAFSAPRYTYVQRNKITQQVVLADQNIIPLKDNYDGSTQEPVNFLPIIPLVLVNGVSGIAVGWSTEILPRDPKDIVDNCIAVLKGKKIKKLQVTYKNYDILSQEIEPNRWEFVGKLQILDHNTVKIVELPPGLSLVKFKERLDKFEEEEKIQDYVDKTTETVDITVKFKRGSLKETTENDLIEFFKLSERKNERIVVLNFEQDAIKQYSSAEILLEEFVEWRLGWYTRRYQKYLADCKQEINFIDAVLMCFEKKLPHRIQSLENKKQLMAEVQTITKNIITEQEQERIVEFATHRWTLDSKEDFEKRKISLEQSSQEYKEILEDKQKLKNIYIQELEKIKKLF